SLGLSSTSRISTRLLFITAPRSQGEIEGRALVRDGVGPDATPMTHDDTLDERQAHAGALVLLGAVQPLEDPEQLVGVLHVEAHPVVPHVVRGLAGVV